jgi:anti-anti-sigma factor
MLNMQIETLESGFSLIRLEGRLDMEGVQAIDNRFSFATTTQKATILIDLSEMSFISSLGIRLLMTSGRAQKSRGGQIALIAPSPEVREVLETSGVPYLLPIFDDLPSAQAALSGA